MTRLYWMAVIGAVGLMFSSSAIGSEVVTAKVSLVEPTYMPGIVSFQLAGGTATCPVGTWLHWQQSADNNKAVYAALLTALATGRRVTFYVANGDTTCTGQFLHVLSD